jgi:general secretion pathway protein C
LPLLASQRWLQRHAPTLLGIALLLAMCASLAWQSAAWLRLLRTPVSVNSTADSETPANTPQPQIDQLFGGSTTANNSAAPSTNLRLVLLGSFVHADPQRSSAIIRSEGNTAQRYTVGSEISSGVRLHAVAADRVELMRNGRRESLSFPLSSSVNGSLQNNAQESMAGPLEQLDEMQANDLEQLRARMDELRQEMQTSDSTPNSEEPTEQPTENN